MGYEDHVTIAFKMHGKHEVMDARYLPATAAGKTIFSYDN